jgi:alkylation response protein AidB-like acyl-CoA dehydrogenase
VVLDPNDPSVERTTHRSLDLTRSVGSATLRGAKVDVVATGAEAEAALEWAGHVAAILLASEQVGAAQAVLDEAVGHACRREQFGRPIGSFQVIKHKCADMFVQVTPATQTCPCSRRRHWPSAPMRWCSARRRTCRCTVESASPGSIPHTST